MFIECRFVSGSPAVLASTFAPITTGNDFYFNGSSWSVFADDGIRDLSIDAVGHLVGYSTPNDRVNNMEGIDLNTPTTGIYFLTVQGYNVPTGPQPYALALSGRVIQMPYLAVPAGKALANGATAAIGTKVVTAVFSDHFYVEQADRSMGIMVRPTVMPTDIQVGVPVDVAGTLATNADSERYLSGLVVMHPSLLSPPAPVGVTNRALGGGDWLYNAVNGAGQKGTFGSAGLNNIGLLVRTTGRVTFSGSGSFYIDDGSGRTDDSGHSGVKVLAPGLLLPSIGQDAVVTGISSCFSSGGNVHPLVKVRTQADIVVLP